MSEPWACDFCDSDEHSSEALRCGHCLACDHDATECPERAAEDGARLAELRALFLARLAEVSHPRQCTCASCFAAAPALIL